MKVAILFSGGKDSTYAVEYAVSRGWDIEYLLSIKPTRKDCYLFHYATVEHTREQARILGLKHILVKCHVVNPKMEANIVKEVVEKNKVDALILGGVGLQVTQLKSVQDALLPLGVEVFAAHAGLDHDKLMEEMLNKGYRFVITQVASDGLMSWLGREVTKENFEELKRDAFEYGFHIGFEGGYADTFVLDGPIFNKRIEVLESRKVVDDAYCGHIVFKRIRVVDKAKKSTFSLG